MPCSIPRKQKMLKTIRVSAMPVAVRLTPSRGGGVPAWTGELNLTLSCVDRDCLGKVQWPLKH